jgi:hypothetical protein
MQRQVSNENQNKVLETYHDVVSELCALLAVLPQLPMRAGVEMANRLLIQLRLLGLVPCWDGLLVPHYCPHRPCPVPATCVAAGVGGVGLVTLAAPPAEALAAHTHHVRAAAVLLHDALAVRAALHVRDVQHTMLHIHVVVTCKEHSSY